MKANPFEIDMKKFKTDRMTSRERFIAMCKGNPVERVSFIPFILGFAGTNTGIPVAEIYTNPKKSYFAQRLTEQQYGIDGMPATGYADYGAWEFGGAVKLPKTYREQSILVTHRPVQTEKQGWELKLPDLDSAGFLPTLKEFGRIQVEEGGSASCFCMTPFCVAVSLTGLERFCRWMITKPELCHHLLRLVTEHRIRMVKHWIKIFGINKLKIDHSTGPDTSDIISPEQFKEFAFPYLKEVHERILEMGFRSIYIHICGEQNLNWDLWEQIPMGDPGMMTFGHQIDLDMAVQRFGKKNIIFGNVAPSLILEGPTEKIYDACRVAIEKGKKAKQGFALMSSCEVSPATPPAHLWVMRKAVNDFGWY